MVAKKQVGKPKAKAAGKRAYSEEASSASTAMPSPSSIASPASAPAPKKRRVGFFAESAEKSVETKSEQKKHAKIRAEFRKQATVTLPKALVEEQKSLEQYSIDDLRRVVEKQIELGVLDAPTIESFLEGDAPQEEGKILCMMNEEIQWTTYNIRGQAFEFPHFMRNPVYLASGGFGTVVKCFRFGRPVAVKKVTIPDRHDWEMALRLLREIVILKQAKKVNQRHVCKIIDIFGSPSERTPEQLNSIFIVMPLYAPGSIENIDIDTLPLFKTIAGHTLNALNFLHKHKILHRDIKKENIFYHEASQKAYLADLGQARRYHDVMSGNGEVGTRCYLSPEILQGHDYDFKSDVYSLGQSWYEMICMPGNKTLFPYGKSGGKTHIEMQKALSAYAQHKREGTLEDLPENDYNHWAEEKWTLLEEKVHETMKDENILVIIENALKFDPAERSDTAELFENPFFADFRTEFIEVDLKEVETDSYDEIKTRIFDLQHGSCLKNIVPGSPNAILRKRCSQAVQYFERQ